MKEQWKTIEEFKANPIIGWCWTMYCNFVCILWFDGSKFEYEHGSEMTYADHDITHVMPIKTPEAPK